MHEWEKNFRMYMSGVPGLAVLSIFLSYIFLFSVKMPGCYVDYCTNSTEKGYKMYKIPQCNKRRM